MPARCPTILSVALALLLAGCSSAPPHGSFLFDKVPYTEVVHAKAPDWNPGLTRLPLLEAGETGALYLSGGGMHVVVAEFPTTITVSPAVIIGDVAQASERYGMAVEGHTVSVDGSSGGGGVGTISEMTRMASVTDSGNVDVAVMIRDVDIDARSGDVLSMSAGAAIEGSDQHADMAMARGREQIDGQQGSDNLAAETASQRMGQDQNLGGQDSIVETAGLRAGSITRHVDERLMGMEAVRIMESVVRRSAQRGAMGGVEASLNLADTTDGSGQFGSFFDSDWFAVLDDDDLHSLLKDFGLLDGYYAADQVTRLDGSVVVPEREKQAYMIMLREGSGMEELIERPFSETFRQKDVADSKEAPRVQMTLDPLWLGVYHHGGKIVYSLVMTNTGTVPIYDALILSGLPENTSFDRFPVADEGGYTHYHVANRSLVAWKLYRPLAPGQTFRGSFVVKLNPWRIPTKAALR